MAKKPQMNVHGADAAAAGVQAALHRAVDLACADDGVCNVLGGASMVSFEFDPKSGDVEVSVDGTHGKASVDLAAADVSPDMDDDTSDMPDGDMDEDDGNDSDDETPEGMAVQ